MAVEVTDLKIGKSYSTEEVHFSGGLRGLPTNQGWILYPVSGDPDSDALLFKSPQSHFEFTTQECDLSFIGTCIHYQIDANSPPMDVWEPGKRDEANGLNAADSWGAVAHQAELSGEHEYADCASYVSVCLKVAGLRLRDVSNRYHEQLKWALRKNTVSGSWFANAALLDLYADFHSLVSELSSARDHLAKLAAIHVAAPDRVDGLARLEDWLERPTNNQHLSYPLIRLLIEASGTKEHPGWLRRLGDIRNEMLHRVPMSANKSVSGLVLEDIHSSQGLIKSIRLAEPLHQNPLEQQGQDPLVELSQLSTKLEHLSRAAWKYAKFPALLPEFTSKSAT